MNQPPLITVYITTKDRCDLLKRAIDSVYSQSYQNFELIVCNDASMDTTDELLHDYQTKHDNFSFYSSTQLQGACVQRNIAIHKAKGEFITGLDDDDYFLPNRLEAFIKNYDKKYSFLCSSYFRNDQKEKFFLKEASGEITLNAILHYNRIGNQVFIETKRLLELGGFDEKLPAFQDYDMWVRLIAKFGSCYKLSTPLYVCDNSHNSERISNNSAKVIAGYEIFIAKHKNLMNTKHLDSMKLLKLSISKEKPNFLKVFLLMNLGNFKSALNQLIK
jgi:glycosyltransferase involved in cell wall biosynthesis